MPSKQFDLLFLAGIFVSVILGFSLFMVVQTAGADSKEWLSFNGSLMGAALGALGTFGATFLLLKSQQNEVKAQKQRELTAARAILASDLDSIIDYLHDCTSTSINCIQTLAAGGSRNHTVLPILSFEILLRLGRLVTMAEPNESDLVSKILTDLQVLKARLSGEIDHFNGIERGLRRGIRQHDRNFDTALISIIQVYIRCYSLFSYARSEESTASHPLFDEENFNTSIRQLGLNILQPNTIHRIRSSILHVGRRYN